MAHWIDIDGLNHSVVPHSVVQRELLLRFENELGEVANLDGPLGISEVDGVMAIGPLRPERRR